MLRRAGTKGTIISPALRGILSRYPRPVALPDGTYATLRPLVSRDEDKLVRLFTDIPYEELRDLHDDVSHPVIVRRWCRNINYDRVLPIVAELDRQIVADATLHRRGFGPAREVGRFRVYVRPEYRRRGLGTVLLREIMNLARRLALKRLAVELYEDQKTLRAIFRRYGFVEEVHLPTYQRVILVREIPDEASRLTKQPVWRSPHEEALARTHQGGEGATRAETRPAPSIAEGQRPQGPLGGEGGVAQERD